MTDPWIAILCSACRVCNTRHLTYIHTTYSRPCVLADLLLNTRCHPYHNRPSRPFHPPLPTSFCCEATLYLCEESEEATEAYKLQIMRLTFSKHLESCGRPACIYTGAGILGCRRQLDQLERNFLHSSITHSTLLIHSGLDAFCVGVNWVKCSVGKL